jgi:predicted nucleic-acid-binding protein
MPAVDTNVLVRFLTHDDAKQAARATAVFHSAEVSVAKTVLLETEWVLRSFYGFTPEQIRAALLSLVRLRSVTLEDAALQAIEWSGRGLDFRDALHLASRRHGEAFVSFDQRLVKRARRAGVAAVELL